MKRYSGLPAILAATCAALQPAALVHAGPLTDLVNDEAYATSFDAVDRTMAVALDAAFVDMRLSCSQNGATCVPESLDALNNALSRLNAAAGLVSGSNNQQAALSAFAGALRGAGPEELSALRLLSNELASDQRDQILGRLNARRTGKLIGAAGADDVPADFSRWGGFLNLQRADGKRHATTLEDGFDLSGVDLSLGTDYLFDSSTVLGAMLSYTDRKAVFAGGAASQGRIASSGLSAVVFGTRNWESLYLSGSFGYQWQSNHLRRFIHFVAPLPVLDAINTGSTDSGAFTVTLDGGRLFNRGAFDFEPTGRVLFRNTRYDAFVEESIDLATDAPSGFALAYDSTSARTLNASLGMRASYTLTPSFGVLVPYAKYELRHEFLNGVLKTQADFADILAAGIGSPTSGFELRSDRPDPTYHAVDLGVSAVFTHGMQAFVNARSLIGLRRADLLVVTMGVRAEF